MVATWKNLDKNVRSAVRHSVYDATDEDVEDLSQSVLAILVERDFPINVKNPEAYIMSVVKSVAITEGKKRSRRQSLHIQMRANWSEETRLTIEEMSAEMWQLMQYLRKVLPVDYFVILFAGPIEDMSNQDLADRLKIPLRTLERRQRDARIVAQTARSMMRLSKCGT